MRKFLTIVAATYLFSVLAMWSAKGFGLEKWHLSITLLAVAGLLSGGKHVLTRHFIAQRAPQFASEEDVLAIVQLWEQTTGAEVVPKWISLIGLLSISATITAILLCIGGPLRWGMGLLPQ